MKFSFHAFATLSFTLTFSLLTSLFVVAQEPEDYLIVDGFVRDLASNKKMPGATVSLLKNGKQVDQQTTAKNGKYSFQLNFDQVYMLVFSSPGYVSKRVSINTKGVPPEKRRLMGNMGVEMSLFQEVPGLDVSILDQPIGKAMYQGDKEKIDWDFGYTASVQKKLDALMAEYERKLKEDEAAIRKQRELDARFNTLMTVGDQKMSEQNYPTAISNYQQALTVKPEDDTAKQKLAAAEKALADQKAEAERLAAEEAAKKAAEEEAKRKAEEEARLAAEAEAKRKAEEEAAKKAEEERLAQLAADYQAAIKAADEAFSAQEYTTAISKYEAALLLKTDPYPTSQIEKANQLIAEQERLAQLQQTYDDVIKTADDHFAQEAWEQAKKAYQQASTVLPEEQYPKDQLAVIDNKLAQIAAEEAAKKAEEEEEERLAQLAADYTAKIKAADDAMAAADYETAIAFYEEANALKPDEVYPSDQITKANQAMATALAKAEEEAKLAQLETDYQAAIAAGDQALKNGEYNDAIKQFEQAIALKPEQYPADQIALAKEKIAAQEAEAALKAQYEALIKTADDLFDKEQWAAAKTSYQEALALSPQEQFPATRIQEIDALLAKLEEEAAAQKAEEERLAQLEADYQAAIAEGDEALANKNYDNAIAAYRQAKSLKAAELYPAEQIAKAEKAKADALAHAAEQARLTQLEEDYSSAIKSGDEALASNNFENAIAAYKEAQSIKPEESYPAEQIAKANEALAAAKAKAEEEARLAAEAEAAKKAEEERLAQIEAEYNQLITSGDEAMAAGNYQKAIIDFGKAKAIKPEEAYPDQQLDKADLALQAAKQKAEEEAARIAAEEEAKQQEEERLAKLEQDFSQALQRGDNAFEAGDLTVAAEAYQEAAKLKPEETYPRARLEQTNTLIAEAQQKAEEEARLAAEAEAKRKAEEEAARIAAEEEAQQKAEEEARLAAEAEAKRKAEEEAARIAAEEEAAKLKAEEERRIKLEADYNEAISTGDLAFGQANYESALSAYQQAASLKPELAYPKEQIERTQVLMKEAKELAAAKKKTEEEARLAAEAEAKQKAEEEAARIAAEEEAAKRKAEEEARLAAEAEAKQKAEEEAARVAAEEEAAKRKAEEEARLAAEAEAKRKAEEEAARIAAEEEAAKRKAEEEARLAAEAEAKQKAEEEAARIAAEEEAAKRKAEEEARLAAEAEAKRKAEEEAARVAAEEEAAKRKAEEEARLAAEAEAKQKAEEEAARIAAEEEAAKRKAEEEARLAAEAEAKQKAEEEAARIAAEEAARQKAATDFKKWVRTGDQALSSGNYKKAIGAYQQAAKLQPENAEITSKIADAKSQLAAEEAQQKKEAEELAAKQLAEEEEAKKAEAEAAAKDKEYNDLIAKADEHFKKKEFKEAKELYEKAATLKPTQSYPKRQITEADKELAKVIEAKGTSGSGNNNSGKKKGGKGVKARPEL